MQETAALLGVTTRQVQRLCKSEKLIARYADGVWLILKDSAINYKGAIKMTEIKINGQQYRLPEGITWTGSDTHGYYASPDGTRFDLVPFGYQAVNDIPYLEEKTNFPGRKKIPLEPVNPETNPYIRSDDKVSPGKAWDLANQMLRLLMIDGKLAEDHEEKLKVIEDQFDKYGDVALKDYVIPRIKKIVDKYQRTKIWDFTLLG